MEIPINSAVHNITIVSRVTLVAEMRNYCRRLNNMDSIGCLVNTASQANKTEPDGVSSKLSVQVSVFSNFLTPEIV